MGRRALLPHNVRGFVGGEGGRRGEDGGMDGGRSDDDYHGGGLCRLVARRGGVMDG